MIRFAVFLCLALVLAGCAAPEGPANRLEKANVLPLALDSDYQFRKILQSTTESFNPNAKLESQAGAFERARLTWGTVESWEAERLRGDYFKFFWRTSRQSDVTVRFEFRQAGHANYVMAMERFYPQAKGSYRSTFEVIGNDFFEFGRVTAWRCLLIVDNKIVAFRQSFMWR